MIFKKGDIVECVNAYSTAGNLQYGEEYVVVGYELKNLINLVGVEGGWQPKRFKLTKNGIVKRILEDL